jgi:uncharacterized protein (DUF2267 family)
MSVQSVDGVERSVHKTNDWLSDLEELLGVNREEAWRILKAFLQVLRDELTLDEAAHLAAQLPLVLRGAFYEGFDPSSQPAKLRQRERFLELLAERARLDGTGEAQRAAQAAATVLRRHVTEGELDDVLAQLPSEVRQVLVPS